MTDWQLERGRPLFQPEDDYTEEMKDWVYSVFDTLPNTDEQPHKSIVELRIWGKYTYEEIANELGLPGKANAYQMYTRAIGWLRDGRWVECGKDEHKFKVWFKGLGEEVDGWL